jgi:hypothetical protein
MAIRVVEIPIEVVDRLLRKMDPDVDRAVRHTAAYLGTTADEGRRRYLVAVSMLVTAESRYEFRRGMVVGVALACTVIIGALLFIWNSGN